LDFGFWIEDNLAAVRPPLVPIVNSSSVSAAVLPTHAARCVSGIRAYSLSSRGSRNNSFGSRATSSAASVA
jgi:hypothetical protein